MRVLDELARELGQLGVALCERGQVWQPFTDLLGRGLGGPAAREQPEGAAVRGVDEVDDLVELGLLEAVAARGRQVLRDVQDRLVGIVER